MYKFIKKTYTKTKGEKTQKPYIKTDFILKIIEKILTILVVVTGVILFLKIFVEKQNIPNSFNVLLKSFTLLKDVFKEETRIESILTIAVTLSGFTITILSIFGIGVSKATEELSAHEFMEDYLKAIKKSLISSVILIIYALMIDEINIDILILIYLYIIIKTAFNYSNLGIITYKMFKINLSSIENEKKERVSKENTQKENITEIILLLEEILKK